MALARKSVLEKALSIQKIILHAFQEASEDKHAEDIKRQIKETEKIINGSKKE